MAKKAAGTATAERGRLAGEEDFDGTYVIPQEAVPAKADAPIGSLADLLARAAAFTDDDADALRTSGHEFAGGWPGSSLNVKLKLSPEESNTFRKLYLALNRSNTRLANGKHVGSIGAVVTWMMEDATRQIEERASA